MTWTPSDAQIDRLREAIEKYGTPEYDNRVTLNLDDVPRIAFRAGIGEAAAEPPSPMVTFALNVELKSLQDELDAALSTQFDPDYARALLAQERALQTTIRRQISIAAAEPPTPGDAEFNAALDDLDVAKDMQCIAAQDGCITDSTTVTAARQYILDLHRQARRAGLIQAKNIIQSRLECYPHFDELGDRNILWPGTELTCKTLIRQIDAMLQGADGEGEQ